MPLKLSIATSQKIGQPNFGSRGASVGLEMEVDSGLLQRPRQLHARIHRLFRLARRSVDYELGTGPAPTANGEAVHQEPRLATPAQVRAIHTLAGQQHLDLVAELRSRCEVSRPEDLTTEEASQFIRRLQVPQNGAAKG